MMPKEVKIVSNFICNIPSTTKIMSTEVISLANLTVRPRIISIEAVDTPWLRATSKEVPPPYLMYLDFSPYLIENSFSAMNSYHSCIFMYRKALMIWNSRSIRLSLSFNA